jgi:nucleotide-binding universal stress UspA family protein
VVPRHQDDGGSALDAACEALRHCTASLETRVRRGNAAEEILREAEEHPTDLIVVGAEGCSAIARFFLGSVAERVARHARCPVLLARPVQGELHKLLVGVDGSRYAERAVHRVGQLPLPDVEIQLVMVLPFVEDLMRARMILPPYPLSPEEAQEYAEQQEKEAQEELARLAAMLAAPGRQIVTGVVHGDPALALIDRAKELGTDLIVVGAQGLSAIERFVMGSVSENVLRYAHCSVLVVKQPAEQRVSPRA